MAARRVVLAMVGSQGTGITSVVEIRAGGGLSAGRGAMADLADFFADIEAAERAALAQSGDEPVRGADAPSALPVATPAATSFQPPGGGGEVAVSDAIVERVKARDTLDQPPAAAATMTGGAARVASAARGAPSAAPQSSRDPLDVLATIQAITASQSGAAPKKPAFAGIAPRSVVAKNVVAARPPQPAAPAAVPSAVAISRGATVIAAAAPSVVPPSAPPGLLPTPQSSLLPAPGLSPVPATATMAPAAAVAAPVPAPVSVSAVPAVEPYPGAYSGRGASTITAPLLGGAAAGPIGGGPLAVPSFAAPSIPAAAGGGSGGGGSSAVLHSLYGAAPPSGSGGGGAGGASGEVGGKRKFLRECGGEKWEDPTLADWPESECVWRFGDCAGRGGAHERVHVVLALGMPACSAPWLVVRCRG